MTNDKHSADARTFTEKIEVAGKNLVGTIQKLLTDASVRNIIIRNAQGRQLLSIPMLVGVGGGALAVLVVPWLTAVAVIGGVIAKVKVEVVRTDGPEH